MTFFVEGDGPWMCNGKTSPSTKTLGRLKDSVSLLGRVLLEETSGNIAVSRWQMACFGWAMHSIDVESEDGAEFRSCESVVPFQHSHCPRIRQQWIWFYSAAYDD